MVHINNKEKLNCYPEIEHHDVKNKSKEVFS